MNAVLAEMESGQQDPAASQHSPQLAQRLRQVATGEVDNRVKRSDACPRSVGYLQPQHVALAKLQPRSQAARALHHRRGQIHTTHLNPARLEVTRNMART